MATGVSPARSASRLSLDPADELDSSLRSGQILVEEDLSYRRAPATATRVVRRVSSRESTRNPYHAVLSRAHPERCAVRVVQAPRRIMRTGSTAAGRTSARVAEAAAAAVAGSRRRGARRRGAGGARVARGRRSPHGEGAETSLMSWRSATRRVAPCAAR